MLRHFPGGVNGTVIDVFRLCNAGGLSRQSCGRPA